MTIYEISVFGQNIEGMETIGGWQIALRTNLKEEAEKSFAYWVDSIGEDNVVFECY